MVRKTAFYGSILFLYIMALSGCGKDPLDPTKIGRFRPVPVKNVILDTLWVGDEPDSTWSSAEDPIPSDLVATEEDYVFGTGDIVGISIFELLQENQTYSTAFQVTESGKISIPDVGLVHAAGRTENELESEIIRVLQGIDLEGNQARATILKDPSVTVTLQQSEKLVYSISGDGVNGDGQYRIPRYDFRLSRALAVAGGIEQFNVQYVYVTRRLEDDPVDDQELVSEPASVNSNSDIELLEDAISPTEVSEGFDDAVFEVVSPSASSDSMLSMAVVDNELEALAAPTGIANESTEKEAEPANEAGSATEWVYNEQESKWERITTGNKPVAPKEPVITDPTFGWEEIETGGVETRVIRIPQAKLFGGDPLYDIIIRPNDAIHVPVDIVGEFVIGGEVNSRGSIPLTGRPITLKMAIEMAGGLGELAWPKRVEITRRIGDNKEFTVMVDLEKIARGEQPDFFIKPYDLIRVGSHSSARYLAVLRNAFTARYGFGFTYDRNFAYADNGQYSGFGF